MAPVLAFAVAVLTAKAAPAYSVYITAPQITFLPSVARLHMICGPDSLACTTIRYTTFHATCEPRDGWQPRIDISLVPYTYLWLDYLLGQHLDVLAHERAHLHDLQTALAQWARALSRQTFDSQTACETAMAVRGIGLRERLQHAAERSQRDRQ